jgi:hypothetical protein
MNLIACHVSQPQPNRFCRNCGNKLESCLINCSSASLTLTNPRLRAKALGWLTHANQTGGLCPDIAWLGAYFDTKGHMR